MMNESVAATILGLVQGLTEFLPVSSSGHLILTSSLLGLHGDAIKTFEVFIQLGSILAVLVLYRQRFIDLLLPGRAATYDARNSAAVNTQVAAIDSAAGADVGFPVEPDVASVVDAVPGAKHIKAKVFSGLYGLWLLFLTCLPASLLGLFAHSLIKTYLFNPLTVALALVVGAVLMLLLERYKGQGQHGQQADSAQVTGSAQAADFTMITESALASGKALVTSLDQFTPKLALGIGLCQCFSLWPGFSRSASTIMGGMVLGADRKTAAEYSFIAAVPIMFAATGFDLLQNWKSVGSEHLTFFAVGFVVSFISAMAAIKIFIGLVGRIGLAPFAWYRLALAPLVYWFFLY